MNLAEIVPKLSKMEAGYKEGMADERCGLCMNYRAQSCRVVAGQIGAEMWCRLYVAKPATLGGRQ